MSDEQNESAELRETTVSKNRAHTACAKESCENESFRQNDYLTNMIITMIMALYPFCLLLNGSDYGNAFLNFT